MRKKRKLWNTYAKTRDHENYLAYKKMEKAVKKSIRKAKKNIESKLAKDIKKIRKLSTALSIVKNALEIQLVRSRLMMS